MYIASSNPCSSQFSFCIYAVGSRPIPFPKKQKCIQPPHPSLCFINQDHNDYDDGDGDGDDDDAAAAADDDDDTVL